MSKNIIQVYVIIVVIMVTVIGCKTNGTNANYRLLFDIDNNQETGVLVEGIAG